MSLTSLLKKTAMKLALPVVAAGAVLYNVASCDTLGNLVNTALHEPKRCVEFSNEGSLPANFGEVEFSVGIQNHCYTLTAGTLNILGLPFAGNPFQFLEFDYSADGCCKNLSAPNVNVSFPSNGNNLEDICANESNIFAGDVSGNFSVLSSEPFGYNAFVLRKLGTANNQLEVDESLEVVLGAASSVNSNGYSTEGGFAVVSRPGVNEIVGGKRYVMFLAANGDRTTSNTFALNVGDDKNCGNPINGLGDDINDACVNLPRANDTDIRFFSRNINGSIVYEENPELSASDPRSSNGTIHHLVGNLNGKYLIAVAGKGIPEGFGQTLRMDLGSTGNEGYSLPNCPDVHFINPNGNPFVSGKLDTVTAYGDSGQNVGEVFRTHP